MASFGQIFYYFLTYLVAEIQNKHYICFFSENSLYKNFSILKC